MAAPDWRKIDPHRAIEEVFDAAEDAGWKLDPYSTHLNSSRARGKIKADAASQIVWEVLQSGCDCCSIVDRIDKLADDKLVAATIANSNIPLTYTGGVLTTVVEMAVDNIITKQLGMTTPDMEGVVGGALFDIIEARVRRHSAHTRGARHDPHHAACLSCLPVRQNGAA